MPLISVSSQKMQSTNASYATNSPSKTPNLISELQNNRVFNEQLKHLSNTSECFPSLSGINTKPKIPTGITPLPTYTSIATNGPSTPPSLLSDLHKNRLFNDCFKQCASNDAECFTSSSGINTKSKMPSITPPLLTDTSITANGSNRTPNLISAQVHVSNDAECFLSSSDVNTIPKPTGITPLPESKSLKTPNTSANQSGEAHPRLLVRIQRIFLNVFTAVRTFLSSFLGGAPRVSSVKDNTQDSVRTHLNLNSLVEVFNNNFDDFLQPGIFRKPGKHSDVNNVLATGKIDAKELPDVHVMCGVIKKTLSASLSKDDKTLMSENLKRFNTEGNDVLKTMKLPEALATILPLLGKLSLDEYAKKTKMDAYNLALCFAPNCFLQSETATFADIADSERQIALIQQLIESSRVVTTPSEPIQMA